MKKNSPLYYCILLSFLFAWSRSFAQPIPYDAKFVDSITFRLPSSPDDTSKVNNLVKLAGMHLFINPALTIKYAKEGAAIAEKIQYHTGRIHSLGQSAFSFALSGEWAKATMDINIAIPLCEKYNPSDMIYMCGLMVITLGTKGDYEQGLIWAQKAIRDPTFPDRDEIGKWPIYMQLGMILEGLNRLDSAKHYAGIVLGYINKYALAQPVLTRESYGLLGNISFKQKEYQQAIQYFRMASNHAGLANIYHTIHQSDSAIYYGLTGLSEAQVRNVPAIIQTTSKILAAEFKESNPEEANKYLNIYIDSKDSMYNEEKLKQLEEIKLNGQRNEYDLKIKETANHNRFMLYSLFIILASLTVLVLLIWRNNRFKQRANQKLEASFNNLKSAQNQLIQSEKMASLGELTAGIAHEIQNPLNFVNNFSDVNKDLLGEMNEEIEKGNLEEVKAIAKDVIDNEEKINHHGKRAESIVKGMLQHSRKSTGIKEPTDINALADEYMRLSYHGLRAKDKSFNAEFVMDLDPTLPLVKVIPQDIGRVLLNLFNNAFWATNERQNSLIKRRDEHKNQNGEDQKLGAPEFVSNSGVRGKTENEHPLYPPAPNGENGGAYHPTVTLSTKNLIDHIEIRIHDNGPGIPPHIIDKIFQPFFTTKPTGQGTGLGLSLAYDIVKAHGGELSVETLEGKGTTFIIILHES